MPVARSLQILPFAVDVMTYARFIATSVCPPPIEATYFGAVDESHFANSFSSRRRTLAIPRQLPCLAPSTQRVHSDLPGHARLTSDADNPETEFLRKVHGRVKRGTLRETLPCSIWCKMILSSRYNTNQKQPGHSRCRVWPEC